MNMCAPSTVFLMMKYDVFSNKDLPQSRNKQILKKYSRRSTHIPYLDIGLLKSDPVI